MLVSIHGCVLNWSYLSFRSMHVMCCVFSSLYSFISDVPQGSTLHPLRFIMYSTPLSTLISLPWTSTFMQITLSCSAFLHATLTQALLTYKMLFKRLNSCSLDSKSNLPKYIKCSFNTIHCAHNLASSFMNTSPFLTKFHLCLIIFLSFTAPTLALIPQQPVPLSPPLVACLVGWSLTSLFSTNIRDDAASVVHSKLNYCTVILFAELP